MSQLRAVDGQVSITSAPFPGSRILSYRARSTTGEPPKTVRLPDMTRDVPMTPTRGRPLASQRTKKVGSYVRFLPPIRPPSPL
jgi:hypothetical protein